MLARQRFVDTRVPASMAFLLCLIAPYVARSQAPSVPYLIDWEEVTCTKPPLPALQSVNVAEQDGKWLVFGGRAAGLHGFGSGVNNFPRSTANTFAYVIDPAKPAVLGKLNLSILGPELANPLTSTNAQYAQRGEHLFVIGGYGNVVPTKDMVTFQTVVRIDVKGLMHAIETNVSDPVKLKPFFLKNSDPRLKVTGGELRWLNGRFLLVFGHRFDGFYSASLGDYNRIKGMQQEYTQKVRVFTLDDKLQVNDYQLEDGGFDSSLPYNRRDLNVVDIIGADGKTPELLVLGGVFKAGQVAGHVTPIAIAPSAAVGKPIQVAWVKDFSQALSHYDCGTVPIFDPASKTMFVTLFGGISQYHYDKLNNQLIKDKVNLDKGIDGLPFIDTVSIVARTKDGKFSQYIWPKRLPGLIGTETRFLSMPPGIAFENGVTDLGRLKGRTLVGYLYGGIEAAEAYSALPGGGTKASPRLFKVWLTPGAQSVLPMPPLPGVAAPGARIEPPTPRSTETGLRR